MKSDTQLATVSRNGAVLAAFCSSPFAVDMAADLLEKAKNRAQEKGQKRAFEDKKAYHSPWDTSPIHPPQRIGMIECMICSVGLVVWRVPGDDIVRVGAPS